MLSVQKKAMQTYPEEIWDVIIAAFGLNKREGIQCAHLELGIFKFDLLLRQWSDEMD